MTESVVLKEWFRHVPEDKWQRDPAANRTDAESIWNHFQLQPGVRVFECPCGKADISFTLARHGAIVQGIDFNAHFVAAARNKFYRAGLQGQFATEDMRQCDLPAGFDLVINWGSSFGYFSDERNVSLVHRMAQSLNPGGRLVIEVAPPEHVIAGRATRVIASGEQVAETFNPETHRASVIFPATRFRGPVAASVRIYTQDEFKAMLTNAGLELEGFYGQGFTPFTPESRRLIVVARRPL